MVDVAPLVVGGVGGEGWVPEEGVGGGMLTRKARVAPSPWLTKMYLRSM